jgi:hypothetical protein
MGMGSASVRDVAWAKVLQGAASAFTTAMTDGRAKLGANELEPALQAAMRAMMIDAMFQNGRAAQVKALLADVAAAIGKAAAANDGTLAALWSKHALALNPEQSDAKGTLAGLSPKANELATKAKGGLEASVDQAVAEAFQASLLATAEDPATKTASEVLTGILGP